MTGSENGDYDFEMDPFSCPMCSGKMTASRPPSLNLDNCSCPAASGNVAEPQGDSDAPVGYPYSNSGSAVTNLSSGSVQVQEGMSMLQDPNSKLLPRAPEQQLPQQPYIDRRQSYSINRYLQSVDPMNRSYHGPWADEELPDQCFVQDRLITGPRQAGHSSSAEKHGGRSSVATHTSYHSGSRSSGQSSARKTSSSGPSGRLDGCSGAGEWMSPISASSYQSNIGDDEIGGD